jgi:biotin carboxylase
MKLVAHSVGVKTPMFVFAYDDEGIEQAANTLDYPMIVKHFNGSGSIGMSKDSKVETKEKLFEMARIMIATYGGALIEEFIEGEEYSVLVAETENEGEVVAYQVSTSILLVMFHVIFEHFM